MAGEALSRRQTIELIRDVAQTDMGMTDARWRTSTRSSNNGGNCVEVADNLPGRVLVRDTKNRDGGTLSFAPSAWQAFVALAKEH